MITPKALEESLNRRLDPIQPVVVGLLIVVILVAIWAMMQPNHLLRTGILTWFLLP